MARKRTQKHWKQAVKTTAGKQVQRKKIFVPQQQSLLGALFAVFTAPVR
jgi:hypothetical protein